MPLNDTRLRRIAGKPYDGPEEIADGGGLSARISPKGLITFQYRYRFNGKPARLKLGTYGKMSIKEARDAMEECKGWLEEGRDPAMQRKKARDIVSSSPSISTLVDEWLETPSVKEMVKYEYWKRMLKLHVTDNYGRLIADEMSPVEWEQIFLRITKGGSPVQAGNVLVKMKQVIRYALRRKRITSNSLMLLEINDVGSRPDDGEWVNIGDMVQVPDTYDTNQQAGYIVSRTGNDFETNERITFSGSMFVQITDSMGATTARYPASPRADTPFGFTAEIPAITLNLYDGFDVQSPSRYAIATSEELDSGRWTVTAKQPDGKGSTALTLAEYSDKIYE